MKNLTLTTTDKKYPDRAESRKEKNVLPPPVTN